MERITAGGRRKGAEAEGDRDWENDGKIQDTKTEQGYAVDASDVRTGAVVSSKIHVNLLLTGGTNYWQLEGKEVFHCHTRKQTNFHEEAFFFFAFLLFFFVRPLMFPTVGRMMNHVYR